MTVKEIMTKDVISVSPDTPVREVILLLLKHHFSGVPVVDSKKDLVGIITEFDLLFRAKLPALKILLEKEAVFCDPKPIIHKYRKIGGSLAKHVMTEKPVTISEEETMENLVDLMIEKKVNPIPVVRGKKLVGIISRSDVMRYLMEEEREFEKSPPSDEEIAQQVAQVLKKNICFPIQNLKVSVQKGKVYLSGQIDSKENLENVEDLVRSIRGVNDVESELLVTNLMV
jgi:CBS domain-containing protein